MTKQLNPGDTFRSPGGPYARFRKGRKMRVLSVTEIFGEMWIDAEPVDRAPRDKYWHSTYPLDELGAPAK